MTTSDKNSQINGQVKNVAVLFLFFITPNLSKQPYLCLLIMQWKELVMFKRLQNYIYTVLSTD